MSAEKSNRWRRGGGGFPCQFEIAVGRHHFVVKRDDAAVAGWFLRLDGVVVALHFTERKAGLKIDLDRHRIDRCIDEWIEHCRFNAFTIGDWIGHVAPAL